MTHEETTQPHHYPFQNTLHVFEKSEEEKKDPHEECCDPKNEAPAEWFIHHFDFRKWQA